MHPDQLRKSLLRPIVWWVVAVVFLTITTLLIDGNNGPPNMVGLVFIGSCLALFAAIGVWISVGSDWRRIPLAIVSASVVAGILLTTGPSRLEHFLLMSFLGALMIGMVAVPIIIFRVFKNGRLAKPDPNEVFVREVLQFGVVHLIGLTTGVAILVWIGQLLAPILNAYHGTSAVLVIKLGTTVSLASLVTVWANLGNRPLIRNAISAPVIGGIAFGNSIFINDSPDGWIFSVLTVIVAVEITILMWCIRSEGFRFISRRREAASTTPAARLDA